MHPPDSAEFRRFWTEDRIDRSLLANSHRMMIGLNVAQDWTRVFGSLVVSGGRGKFLTVRHSQDHSVDVPDELAARLQSIGAAGDPSLSKTVQARQDLADCQSGLVEGLGQLAGKYVDRILGVTVSDPGFWCRDFDGTILYQSGCDPDRLAELTGLNVIDALPASDLAALGNGRFLASLPLWFMFADRQMRGATSSTLVLVLDHAPHWYMLPGSDGLDDLLPEIVAGSIFEETPKHQLSRQLQSLATPVKTAESGLPVGALLVISNGQSQAELVQFLTRMEQNGLAVEQITPDSELAPCDSIAARTTAMLGMLFTDQLPSNVPSLTGAKALRMLGRLTPGKPFSWRNLLAVMADSHSTPMRLRDAI